MNFLNQNCIPRSLISNSTNRAQIFQVSNKLWPIYWRLHIEIESVRKCRHLKNKCRHLGATALFFECWKVLNQALNDPPTTSNGYITSRPIYTSLQTTFSAWFNTRKNSHIEEKYSNPINIWPLNWKCM